MPDAGGESWLARKQRALEACEHLREHPHDASTAQSIADFASDPKWEIRKVIAEALAGFPDDLYQALTPTLSTDQNALVRAAAQRSLERRTPISGFASAGQTVIQKSLDRIESKFGPDAASAALRFAEKYAELHLKSAVHDIKNVLAHLRLDVEPVVSAASASLRSRIKRVEKGRVYLERLVEMMEAYSEDMDLNLRSEEIADIAREASVLARDQVAKVNRLAEVVAVELEVPEGLVAPVSRYHFAMVLTNLIKNGIEAHAVSATEFRQGKVAVRAKRDGEWIVIAVEDTGRGIAPGDLLKLQEFIPGGSTKHRAGSSGYGLPICRRYIEAHHGTLHIESKEDKGTLVTIRVPAIGNHNAES